MSVNFSIGHAAYTGNRSGNSRKKMNPIFSVILGCCFIGFGFYSQWEQTSFVKSCKKTDGVVISHVKKTDSDNDSSNKRKSYSSGIYYCPVVEFITLEGERLSFTASSQYKSKSDIPEGTKVNVYYDPANPNHARLRGTVSNAPKIAWGGGGLFIVVGIAGMIIRKRKKSASIE